jgi:hypothetical protein
MISTCVQKIKAKFIVFWLRKNEKCSDLGGCGEQCIFFKLETLPDLSFFGSLECKKF